MYAYTHIYVQHVDEHLEPYQYQSHTPGGPSLKYPGLLKPATREKWERDLFGGCYDGAKASPRVNVRYVDVYC